MANNAPTVFVSSTCYDLRQVRDDLSLFLENELGYRSMLSDQNSFPVDPDADLIENCRRRVEQDADILVLIVGGRYGFVDADTSKSVTNLEYLTARSLGIPIYAFIENSILAVMPVWEQNKEGNFKGTVDNPQLFEFVKDIRERDKVWAHGFSTAQDITTTLKSQFAHLMGTGLHWRRKVLGRDIAELNGLSGKAFRIALEKPKAWEYKLFAQVLMDSVAEADDLLREYKLGIRSGRGDRVAEDEIGEWVKYRLADLRAIAENLKPLIDDALQQALGPEGVAGDVRSLVFVGQKIGLMYSEALEWALAIRRAHVDDIYKGLIKVLERFSESIVTPISEFGPDFLSNLDDALADPNPGAKQLTAVLTLGSVDDATFGEELNNILRAKGLL